MKIVMKFIFFLFSVISILSTVVTSQSNMILSSFLSEHTYKNVDSAVFLRMIASENHYFAQDLEEDNSSILSNAIQIATNINVKDVRSLIFDEVPGLFSMTSDIVVAGEGTDFTNLPIESSPPIEELLKDREVVEENIADIEEQEPSPQVETPDKNVVFIYHTHSRESFIPVLKDSTSANDAQSKDINITMVGERLGTKLIEKGIGAQVDKTDIADILSERGWKYGQSYTASREVVEAAITQNSDLVYLLDIHRDSAQRDTTTTTINGKSYAKLYFIVGSSHPGYEKNEQFATELNEMIKQKYSSLTRGVFNKSKTGGNNGVYNQDLSPNSVVIEIGGPENTLEEMYNTVDLLAEIFAEYYWQKTNAVEVSGE